MAIQALDARPYIVAIRQVVALMQMPKEVQQAINHALARHSVHLKNQRFYAQRKPLTREQLDKKAEVVPVFRTGV
jgi:hypothetical protein